MKFVLLIHSNPQPWAHPTSEHTAEYAALPPEEQDVLGAHWDDVVGQAEANGEILGAWPLADPRQGTVYRHDGRPVASAGPYATDGRPLAGVFLLDVATRERAEQIAEAFSCPGDDIELRAVDAPRGEE